jgi:CDGSH-type Zn-finger protein
MTNPVIASRSPIGVDVVAGRTYWWCTCGRSKRQPFCDGTHNPTQFKPLKCVAKQNGQVWFCACKHTGTAPLCDGSHKGLPPAKE